jgi:hypothetical protein
MLCTQFRFPIIRPWLCRKSIFIRLYIPAGANDVLQPLDRRVFGVLKSQDRRLFHGRVNENHLPRRTQYEACEDLMTLRISSRTRFSWQAGISATKRDGTEKISKRTSSINVHTINENHFPRSIAFGTIHTPYQNYSHRRL